MGKITEKDREFIRQMKNLGVLAEVNPHRLDQSQGIIMVTCADGDQMPDIFQRQVQSCLVHRPAPRIHTLALNGGALLIPPHSPLCRERREDKVLLHHIQTARELKNIHTVALYAHLPCGAAEEMGLSAMTVFELLTAAKTHLKKVSDQLLKVACFCHIDYGNDYKQIHFVSRRFWLGWQEEVRKHFSLRQTQHP